MAKAQNYRAGDTTHTFLMRGTNGGGEHHTTLKESIYWEGGHRTHFVVVGTAHNIPILQAGTECGKNLILAGAESKIVGKDSQGELARIFQDTLFFFIRTSKNGLRLSCS